MADGAIYRTGEELQDYQLRTLRNTFRDLVRQDGEETVQRPGGVSGDRWDLNQNLFTSTFEQRRFAPLFIIQIILTRIVNAFH